jgi:hypothetical protein
MMEGTNYSSLGMFIVGFGMVANGLLMTTRREMDM